MMVVCRNGAIRVLKSLFPLIQLLLCWTQGELTCLRSGVHEEVHVSVSLETNWEKP